MAYMSIYKGIIFIEGEELTAKWLGEIEYKKNFSFGSQLKTIDCVKDQLAEKTTALGGNAVVNFKYGQKSSGWFKSSLFALDDNIKWYGSGVAALLPDYRYKEIIESKKQ